MKPDFFEALLDTLNQYKPAELTPVQALIYTQIVAGIQFVVAMNEQMKKQNDPH